MKKIIVFSLILALTLCLAACDLPGTDNSATSDPTGSSVNSDPTGNSNPSDPSDPSDPSEPSDPHDHVYNIVETIAPKCKQKGEKIFECECGDSYSESIDATGHDWNEWVTLVESTFTTKGTATRECKNCDNTDSKQLDKLTVDQEMARLGELIINGLPHFESVDELTVDKIFEWACNGAGSVFFHWDPETGMVTKIYNIDDLDAFTSTYLGKTFNYLDLLEYHEEISYVEENHQLVIKVGAYGGDYMKTMDSYEKIDDTHYKLRYFVSDYDMVPLNYNNIYLVLTENGFMIESHTRES